MSLFTVHPNITKSICVYLNFKFNSVTYIFSGNLMRRMSFTEAPFFLNQKHILNILLQELGNLDNIHQNIS